MRENGRSMVEMLGGFSNYRRAFGRGNCRLLQGNDEV